MFSISALLLAFAVAIEGPSQIDTPQPVIFEITGLPVLDSTKPLDGQLDWLQEFKFIVNAPENVEARTRQKLFFEPVDGRLTWFMELTVTPSAPGVYVLVGPDYLNHRLVVGGTTPPINPTKALQAILVLESKTQTIDQSILTNQLRNDTAWSRKIRIADPHQRLSNDQPDPQIQRLLTHGPEPRFFLLDAAGNVVGHFSLPQTWPAARSLLQKHGLQP